MGLKKNSPGCGCCNVGCCNGDGLPCVSVTFGNRYKQIESNCFTSESEANASGCESLTTDLKVILSDSADTEDCKLIWVESSFTDARRLYYSAVADSVQEFGGPCFTEPDSWHLNCIDPQFSRLMSVLGAAAITVDYTSDTIDLVIREDLPDQTSTKTFELRYTHGSTICGQSLSLTIADFTVVSSTQSGSTPVSMSSGTLAISVDVVIEASSECE